ncbi:ribonuclease Z/Hydroxyacylglutathione hydrolase like protein [Babesia gibsoni]|uniref:Ribonuclease Z/Hydroxyacylglutathione hydrolase like protein n=1 Tax=Babesia gibsoni TaxID=33632 RepID=A0AAD8LJ47_BABGI|nr:ribonuclease Z/Hydroxyacylglutathione hydrolase like protein [Babesia gibsoni]
MRLLPWFINPWHSLGDVSKYKLSRQRGAVKEKIVIAICRKIPFLESLLGTSPGKWPAEIEGRPVDVQRIPLEQSSLTYLGHRTVYIQTGGASLLTDPIFSRRLYMPFLGVPRVSRRTIKFWQLPMVDFVLVSNNSYDSIDPFSIRRLGDLGAALVVGGMNVSKFLMAFFKRYTYPLNWYESVNFGSIEITFLPSFSNSGRRWYNRDLLLWGSFFVRSDNRTVYYAGRTAYGSHFKEIREYLDGKGYKVDVAILPMGPIYNHSPELTPEEAVKVHLELGAKKSLVIAHDTFSAGLEAYGELEKRLRQHVLQTNPSIMDQFIILREGETADISSL